MFKVFKAFFHANVLVVQIFVLLSVDKILFVLYIYQQTHFLYIVQKVISTSDKFE